MGLTGSRLHTPARALLVIDRPLLAEVVKLALDHGKYSTRVAQTLKDARAALGEWRPHLVVLDTDVVSAGALDQFAVAKGGRGCRSLR